MKLKTFVCGRIMNNCYVLNMSGKTETVIIDPGYPNKELEKYLFDNNLDVKYIILTHGHDDHTGGIDRIKELFPEVKLIAGKNEAELLFEEDKSMGPGGIVADINVTDGESLDLCGMHFDIIETPGHTPGGISIYMKAENTVFTGDTLFFCSIGRTDFPGGNYNTIINSIVNKLFLLPDNTKVYPGHDMETSIGFEKEHNPFVN